MTSFWLRQLQSVFGKDRVEDALDGTALAPLGKQHNFGLYVVRKAIDADTAKQLMVQSKIDIGAIIESTQRGSRAVAVQGNTKVKFYNSMQACAGACRCKYVYEGTNRHEVYGINQFPSLKSHHEWLHKMTVVPSVCMFNEALLNVYSHEANERIPWHTDRAGLYKDDMEVAAMNLGDPGIYCFAPQQKKKQQYGLSFLGHVALGAKKLLFMVSEECCQFVLVT